MAQKRAVRIISRADFNAHTNTELDYNLIYPGNNSEFDKLLNPEDQTRVDIPTKYKVRTSLALSANLHSQASYPPVDLDARKMNTGGKHRV